MEGTYLKEITMTIQLYGKQQIIVNDITQSYNNYLQNPKGIFSNGAFISGEMGVGKTYMGAVIVKNMKKDNHVTLIISPASTTHKWQKVLNELIDTDVVIFNPKDDTILQNGVLIMRAKDLTNYLKMFKSKTAPMFDFIIYDEIHTLKPKLKPFENLTELRNNFAPRKTVPLLGLTGTIFSQSVKSLQKVLELTHPEYQELQANGLVQDSGKTDLPRFMYYWTKIAWSISLKDVESDFQSDNTDDIEQTIAPIKLIDPTEEQKAVYNVAKLQMSALSVANAPAKATNILDLPSQAGNLIKSRTNKKLWVDGHTRQIQTAFNVGFTLTDVIFEHTPKYQELTKILTDNHEKTLIFANEEDLIKQLATSLTNEGFSVATMPKSIKAHDFSNYINEQLSGDAEIFIINPMKISTGVDITTASRIIWYQLLNDLGSTLQAQRRVYRLSSTKSSIIHFLAYSRTYQETLINEISDSAKNNAVSYGQNDTSNLAKLTGLLFG